MANEWSMYRYKGTVFARKVKKGSILVTIAGRLEVPEDGYEILSENGHTFYMEDEEFEKQLKLDEESEEEIGGEGEERTKDEFYEFTVAELKTMLKERDLEATGNKDELVDRLWEYEQGNEDAG